jgi:glycosyltransferase involved in cell wall biosynthesis
MMAAPPVSIGFPVYNGESSVAKTLDSILAQDFADFELILCDNASTDKTREICEGYARRDPRIRYVRNEENIGAGPNHNKVFHLGRGKYFQWTAHDLECLPGMLRRCFEYIQSAPPHVVMAYPRWQMVDPQGRPTGDSQMSIASADPSPHRRLYTVLHRIQYVSQFYGLAVSDVLRQTRLFDSFPSSDYVLLAEMAMLCEIREIPEVLFRREMDPERGTIAVRASTKKWLAWLDPQASRKKRRGLLSYQQRLALEYFRSARRLPLRPADKLRCMVVGPATPYYRDVMRATGPLRQKCRSLFKS